MFINIQTLQRSRFARFLPTKKIAQPMALEADQILAVTFGINLKRGHCLVTLKNKQNKVLVTEAAQDLVDKLKKAGVEMTYLHNLWINADQIEKVGRYRGHIDEKDVFGRNVFVDDGSIITMRDGNTILAYDNVDRVFQDTGVRPENVYEGTRVGSMRACKMA